MEEIPQQPAPLNQVEPEMVPVTPNKKNPSRKILLYVVMLMSLICVGLILYNLGLSNPCSFFSFNSYIGVFILLGALGLLSLILSATLSLFKNMPSLPGLMRKLGIGALILIPFWFLLFSNCSFNLSW